VLKILKLFLSLASLAAFVWFALTVPLGDRTFFGHVKAIAQSRESQELVKGTKDKVTGLLDGKAEKGDKAPRAGDKTGEKAEKPGRGGKAAPGDAPEHLASSERARIAPNAPTAPPQESLTDSDREGMRKLLEARGPK
jgi:hypothetical protein